MEGVVRTRVGYAGGSAADPTYRRMGDHTECVQVDFDPARISYDELLDAFFQMHNPARPPYSVQYASRILTHDDEQYARARETHAAWAERLGTQLHTTIVPLKRFYNAEDYHQKYGLRADRTLMREFEAYYPGEAGIRESTAAARVNGYLYAGGPVTQLDREIESYGLSAAGMERLRTVAGRGW